MCVEVCPEVNFRVGKLALVPEQGLLTGTPASSFLLGHLPEQLVHVHAARHGPAPSPELSLLMT